MKDLKGKHIEEIINKLNPEQKEIADKLRSIVKTTLPDAVEKVKWGNIVYSLKDKDVAWLLFYAQHVDLGFFKGAELDSDMLEGTGKSMRHIKIKNVKDIKKAEIIRLLEQAAKLEKK